MNRSHRILPALLAAIVAASVAPAAHAIDPNFLDVYVPATPLSVAPTSNCVDNSVLLNLSGIGSVGIVLTGTWSGTVTFKVAADTVPTYNNATVFPQAGGAGVSTATGNGTWFLKDAAAYKRFCAYFSTATSGTVSISLNGSIRNRGVASTSDVATIGGSAVALGSAVAASSFPVTIASDDGLKPAQGSTTSGQTGPLIQGAAATNDPTTTAADTWPLSLDVKGALRTTGRTRPVAYGSSPTATVAGTPAQMIADLEGRQYVNTGHPRAINCYLATTATTSTQITGCEVVASNSIYITSACISGDILNATATPFILQSGTSTACTGPHVLWSGWHPALTNYCVTFPVPIKVTQAEGLCLLDATTGSKSAMISGYVAP